MNYKVNFQLADKIFWMVSKNLCRFETRIFFKRI